jgi:alditol oxidase
VALANWAGNYIYKARELHRPATVEQLREIVAAAPRLRVLGSRHSFTDIVDSDELVTLDRLPSAMSVDPAGRTVSLAGGVRYGELAEFLNGNGLALANLASLPHISVAGAIATATHGSGNRNLASSVASLELVRSDGELVFTSRGDPDFEGIVVSLGALGAVTGITLDVEPAYEVRQDVFERLPWDALFEHFDEITEGGYSVSAFTLWGPVVDQVWIKSRVGDAAVGRLPKGELFGAAAATANRNPVPGADPNSATPQLGVPGPWSERLPHFRMGFTPSAGEEIQSEYLVPRRHALAAIEAMRRLGAVMRPVLQIAEIRTIAADRLWMSTAYGKDMIGLHFTWRRDEEAVKRVLAQLEAVLMPLEARPHWGKLFLARADAIGGLYPRLPDFRGLLERMDPRGAFRNEWLEARVLG